MTQSGVNRSLPIFHPGFLLSHTFELEIARQDDIELFGRDNTDKVNFTINSFNLPEISSQTFDIVWGPGFPRMTYPGPTSVDVISLDLTNFYDKKIVDFFACWYEGALVNILDNLHDGHIIGKDDEGVVQYKADVFRMWPMRFGIGQKERSTNRHLLNVSLFVWDIIHSDEADRRRFDVEEGCR